jgi:uncharacterized protein (TIGR02246 family)
MTPRQNAQSRQGRRIGKRAGLVGVAVLVSAGTLLASTTTTAVAGSGKKAKPSEEEIAALFDEWNEALLTGDPEQVADRYAPDALLLPTKSSRIRTDRQGIVDYFTHFTASNPVGEKDYTDVTVLDGDSAVDAGTYTFTLTDDETGALEEVAARYTFAYEKIDGEWLIINHHSSETPVEE